MNGLIIVILIVGIFALFMSSSSGININDKIVDAGLIYGNPQKMYDALIKKHGYSAGEATFIMYERYEVEFLPHIQKQLRESEKIIYAN